MKKLMFLMMALLVAPAMATVTITVVDNPGTLTADIVVTADGADTVDGLDLDSLVAGIALDVSVSPGTIVAVTDFMATGESIDGDEGYGIYMGTITFTGGDPEEILNVGTPVAPATAPDNPGQLGSSAIVLEFGCLYNVNTPEAAPLASTTLCTIEVSEAATLTLGENATRGGVVLIGGGAPSGVVLESALVTGGVVDCYTGQPDYDEWVAVGKPESWCNRYQCRGDADNAQETTVFVPFPSPGHWNYTWVGDVDVGLFLAAYKQPVGGAGENLAADFDHLQETTVFVPFPSPGHWNYTRVGDNDVGIFLAGYKQPAGSAVPCGNPVLP